MKILLINPPCWNELVGKHQPIIRKYRGFSPPLGLLYIASSLKKIADYEIEILDTQPAKLTYDELKDYLKGRPCDVVGIPAMTFTLLDVCKTVKLVKDVMPAAKIVLGGPHVYHFPLETISLDGVDFAIQGEAEFSFIEFLKNFKNPSSYDKVAGLVFKDMNGKVRNNSFTPIDDLDTIPFPQRALLNINCYDTIMNKGSISTTIITSRGCIFKCAFCDRPLSPAISHLRFRSAGNVVDEICGCVEMGINDFSFYDDTFTVDKKRVLEICEEILRRGLEITWNARTRVDVVNEEMLKLMKRAGCASIHYGVEAGNDRILKLIKKGFTVKRVREVFKLTQKIGMETLAYFIIGLPSQDLQDIQDTFDLAKELSPDYTMFSIFTPQPGTELYRLGLETGVIKKDIWKEFAARPAEGFKLPVWDENFTRDQLYGIITKFYRSFYLRPSYIFSQIRKIKSRYELMKKVKAGTAVLFMRKEDMIDV